MKAIKTDHEPFDGFIVQEEQPVPVAPYNTTVPMWRDVGRHDLLQPALDQVKLLRENSDAPLRILRAIITVLEF